MAADRALVATGLLRGAGLFVRDPGGWRRLDHLASTGLAVSPDGQQVARALWTSDDPQTHGELIISDATGALRYLRVDELQEPHGLVWDRDDVVAVSTLRNALLWIDAAGRVTRRRTFPGDGDAWHVNCPAWAGSRLVATAFGQHDRHRDWAAPGAMAGGGIIVDVESGTPIATGLSAPHDPVPLPGGGWLVCDSKTHRLLRLDHAGTITGAADLGGWTRGLVVDGDEIHVGVSVRRWDGGDGTASVVTLRRDDLTVLGREPLPCDEIFALVLVPRALVDGLAVGFSTNPAREAPLAPHGDALAAGDAWDDAQLAVTLAAHCDAEQPAGRWFAVSFELASDAPEPALPVGAATWRIGARWIASDGTPTDTGARARWPAPIPAGGRAAGTIRVHAPERAGTHTLELRLVQEQRRWHETAAAQLSISVTTR